MLAYGACRFIPRVAWDTWGINANSRRCGSGQACPVIRRVRFAAAWTALFVILATTGAPTAGAQSFVIQDGQTVTTQQTLNTDGDTGTIKSGGTLTTTTVAVSSSGANVSIDNQGSISTTTGFGFGFSLSGASATIVNSGSISTSGTAAQALRSMGTNASVVNSGALSTTGDNGHGIHSGGTGVSIVNSGSISTTGTTSNGINSNSTNALIVNSGSISTTGTSSAGIVSHFTNASIVNSGSISTTGNNGHGIYSYSTDASIVNSGTITVSGAGSQGVQVSGAGSVLTNTGTISATGSATQAILGGAGAQTLNIGAGSQIIGTIDLGADTDTVNITGNGPASRMTFVNVETINLQSGIAGVVTGSTVTTVDPTGFSVLGAAQNTVTTGVHGKVDARVHAARDDGIVVASAEPSVISDVDAGYGRTVRPTRIWFEAFGGKLTRDGTGETLSYTQTHLGIVVGADRMFDGDRYGATFGYAESGLKTDITSMKTDSVGVFGGAYGQTNLGGGLTLGTNLIAGYEDYDTERRVADNQNGFETATAEFNSVYVSPSVSLHYERQIGDRLFLRPSGALVYTASLFDGYTEHGTTASNLKVGRRTAHTVNARAELAVAHVVGDALAQALGESHDVEVRVGLEDRFSRQDDIDASLAGNSFRFAPSDDTNVTGAYIGARARIDLDGGWFVVGDVEHRRASGNERSLTASFRTIYTF